jgi:Sec-independent protein translocase protein TatA
MVILVLHKEGVCMKMFKVILLGVMLVMFSSVSLARGGGGGGGAGRGGQTRDQTQDQTRDQTQDQTRDQTRSKTQDQTRDQTRSKTQDRDRLHNPGTNTTTPPTAPTNN